MKKGFLQIIRDEFPEDYQNRVIVVERDLGITEAGMYLFRLFNPTDFDDIMPPIAEIVPYKEGYFKGPRKVLIKKNTGETLIRFADNQEEERFFISQLKRAADAYISTASVANEASRKYTDRLDGIRDYVRVLMNVMYDKNQALLNKTYTGSFGQVYYVSGVKRNQYDLEKLEAFLIAYCTINGLDVDTFFSRLERLGIRRVIDAEPEIVFSKRK